MKSLYNRKGVRRSESERHQFAFFVAGSVVLLVVVFVIGIQAGRVIERKWGRPEIPVGKGAAGAIVEGRSDNAAGAVIGKEMAAFSEEAAKVPAVDPQGAREQLEETERNLTFRQTLSKKAAEPVPLEPRAGAPKAAPARRGGGRSDGAGHSVQAGAFRDRAGADALAAKAGRIGMRASVTEAKAANGKTIYRVLVGPYAGEEEARAAIRTLKQRMKIDGFLVRG